MRRADRHDIAPCELKLIRVGHWLWRALNRARRAGNVSESEALYAALRTVWRLKHELRAELRAARAIAGRRLAARFAAVRR